jgi:DNA-binding NtrC family response regulator
MHDPVSMFLIVDDEPDMCWALQHVLKTAGFCSQFALGGQEALELIGRHKFTLVFVDAKLPDIDGLELAREIRELDPTTKVVMVSGYFYQDDVAIQKAFQENIIIGFISKPFLNEEIIRIIETTGVLDASVVNTRE